MIRRLSITVALSLGAFISYGQKGRFKPFKVVIISPDTVVIGSSLQSYVAQVQDDHLKAYLTSLERMERLGKDTTYTPNEPGAEKEWKEYREETKKQLEYARAHEAEIRAFRFYQVIPEYSSSVLNFYFNEYPPYSNIGWTNHMAVTKEAMRHVADSLDADYVIGYRNLYTVSTDSGLIIKLTTMLYARADQAILLEKETIGDTLSRGDMWTCGNPLECLLITAVKSSTDEVAPLLAKRQLKSSP